jgi:hypothetical protein
MTGKPATVQQYLDSLPADRRDALEAVRRVILANLGEGYAEGIQYGMIGYFVPHAVYPAGYHCDPKQPLPFASIASQKNHMAVYLCSIYGSEDEQRWLREAWAKSGKRLDMGKACIRFRKIEDLPLDVIGKAIKRMPVKKLIAQYEAVLGRPRGKNKPSAKPAAKKAPTKRGPAKKMPTKKAPPAVAAKKSPRTGAAAAGAKRTSARTTGKTGSAAARRRSS